MAEFDRLMSSPFFNAGMGILQGQTPSRTRPNFAANAMGGLQNAMSNRAGIQEQNALMEERSRKKILFEQQQAQLKSQEEFLASINASRMPTSGLPKTPPGQWGGIPTPLPGQPMPGQSAPIGVMQSPPEQQDPVSTYVSQKKAELNRVDSLLASGNIPDIATYNKLLEAKESINQEIFEATKPQDDPSSVLEYEYAKKNDMFPGTLQEWMQAKRGGMEMVSDGQGGFTFRTNVMGNNGGPRPGSLSTDYTYLRDGNGELILDEQGLPQAVVVPGSATARRMEEEARVKESQQDTQIGADLEKGATMLDSIDAIRKEFENSGGQPVSGTRSIIFGKFSETPAGRARSLLGPLQSGIALNAMARLKAASSTGSTGFGAMNAQELQLLIDDIGALNMDTTEEDIILTTLNSIEGRYTRVMEDIVKNVSPEKIRELGLESLIDSYNARKSNANQPNAQTESSQKTVVYGANR